MQDGPLHPFKNKYLLISLILVAAKTGIIGKIMDELSGYFLF